MRATFYDESPFRSTVMPPSRRPKIRVAGSKRAPLPAFIEPCHPVVGALPDRKEEDRWAPEVKFDGYRAQAHIAPSKITLYTRRGYDWTQRFATVAHDLETLQPHTAIVDGEIGCVDPDGTTNFKDLWFRGEWPFFLAFDLLAVDGKDFRALPLVQRKTDRRVLGKMPQGQGKKGDQGVGGGTAKAGKRKPSIVPACNPKLVSA